MVRKVLAWKKEKADESLLLWETLQRGNDDFATELERLSTDSTPSFENLATIILTNRSLIREMSDKAGVPIEPHVQTNLLDACTSLPGVIGGVVPGAGGYDALALIIEDNEETMKQLTNLLNSYKPENASSGPTIGNVRLLGARQEMRGLVGESLDLYQGWL